MYKNILASEYSILLLIPSCTPVIELALLALVIARPGGGYYREFLIGVCSEGPWTLTLFKD